MIRVTYSGSHNFDLDSRLETIAEQPRSDSSMNFEVMDRHVDFEFADEAKGELFCAAVRSQFPDFKVSNET